MKCDSTRIRVKAKQENTQAVDALCKENSTLTELYVKQLKKNRLLSICLAAILIIFAAAGAWAYIVITDAAAANAELSAELDEARFKWTETFFEYYDVKQERDFHETGIRRFAIVFPGEKIYHQVNCGRYLRNMTSSNPVTEWIAYDYEYCSNLEGYEACECWDMLEEGEP